MQGKYLSAASNTVASVQSTGKLAVMLDVAFLGHSREIRRGAERVARHLFEGLYASGECDLSYIATSHLAGAYEFLRSHGVSVDRSLKFTDLRLSLSRVARSLTTTVHRSLGNRSLPKRAARYFLANIVGWCTAGESSLSEKWLRDVAIYHSPHTPFPPSVRNHARLRKFITCHDFIPLKNPEYYPPSAMNFIAGVLDCLQPQNFAFCVSETTRNDVLTYSKMPPERVFVTPLAAEPETFYPVTDPGIRENIRKRYNLGDEPYFLALSAHDPHKNFPHLIECFGRAVESGELRDCNLAIVGPNPGRNPAAADTIAKFPRAAQKIRVLGFVPDEDLAAIYSASIGFLFPSVAEGFGIPPLEAMQCGVPVIASNTTSIPEVVGDAGLLLPPTDKDLWCAAMLNLAANPKVRLDLSNRSIKRAKLFSWEHFIAETLRGYRASIDAF